MVGKFPACVLHLTLPANTVDVNVHPAKTEVKFLSEKAVFDCVHYGVLGALNKQTDRPQVQFKEKPPISAEPVKKICHCEEPQQGDVAISSPKSAPVKKESFFRTVTAEEYKTFSTALKDAPQPRKEAAAATLQKIERPAPAPLRETVLVPGITEAAAIPVPKAPVSNPVSLRTSSQAGVAISSSSTVTLPESAVQPIPPKIETVPEPEVEQVELAMPKEMEWRMVGELYNSYIIVEQGEEAFLIDKHAAHERILFEKLKANQEAISAQTLLTPVPVRLSPSACAELLTNTELLAELGFEIEEFGENTVLLRQIPMDLSPDHAAESIEALSADLLAGRRESKDTVRDELLHTVACKAAIKAGWKNDEAELLAVAKQVMSREDLKYCPHGRPICVTLSKKQLEKQFKRT